ncbi:MAG: rod shape-determining protein RodA [Rikenellaceae bacterium]
MAARYKDNETKIFGGVDWTVVLIYFALVFAGLITIFAAVYNPEHSEFFTIKYQHGAQMVWIGVSSVIALSILLIDDRYIFNSAYILYALTMLTLVAVLIFGTEVNGARSWFQIGSFRLQPSEFAKFTTGLALARYIGSYNFNIKRMKDIVTVFGIAMLPALIIVAQNDTGSALVYGSFMLMFYREGFYSWVYMVLIVVISLFIASFLLESWIILAILLMVLIAMEGMKNGEWLKKLSVFASILLVWVVVNVVCEIFFKNAIALEFTLLMSIALISPFLIVESLKMGRREIIGYITLFFASAFIVFSVDYVFNNVMKVHQQKRILDTLGLENDTRGWGYNVNQSKIAIGSGGFFGKGYLNGTQTKYDFVPEQSTDFIFCTVGEEWGFIGSTVIVVLFLILILRLMRMGDNQREGFNRVYCYFVASVLLFHVVINVGMTIGLMPVIGIPLPFFSYGGSSLMSFTILLFIAVRLDSRNNEHRI